MSQSVQLAVPKERRFRWLRRLFRRTLIALPVLVLITLALRYYYQRDSEKELAKAIAELDATDPRWRFEDILAERKHVPDEENSVPLVMAAAKLIPKNWPETSAIPPPPPAGDDEVALVDPMPPAYVEPGTRWFERLEKAEPNQQLPPDALQSLRAELKAIAPALAAARKLIDGPRMGRFDVKWEKNWLSTLLPGRQETRYVANLNYYEAVLSAHEGKCADALASCRGIVGAGGVVGDEPTMISLLVRIACDALAVSTVERALALGESPPNTLTGLQARFAQEDQELRPLLLFSLRAERVMQFNLYGYLAEGELPFAVLEGSRGKEDGWYDHGIGWLYGRTLMRYAQTDSLQLMTRGIDVARLPFTQQAESFEAWGAEMKAKFAGRPTWNKGSLWLLPAVNKVAAAHHKGLVSLRCAQIALAAERYRIERGQWPESLNGLVPSCISEIPQDPFDGKPLRLARRPDGLMIYSVGYDGQDDGGNVVRNAGTKPGTDMGFRLWDPAKRRQPAPVVPVVVEQNP